MTNNAAVADGTSLAIGAGGVLIFDPTASGAPQAGPSPAGVAAPVPEPGTIALLLAALWSAAIYASSAEFVGEFWLGKLSECVI